MNQFEQEVNRLLTEAYKAGIREVVEWIRTHSHCGSAGGASSCIASWEWQARQKEWNLEDE